MIRPSSSGTSQDPLGISFLIMAIRQLFVFLCRQLMIDFNGFYSKAPDLLWDQELFLPEGF